MRRRCGVAIVGLGALVCVTSVGTRAHALRLLDAGEPACPSTPLPVPEALRQAAQRLAEVGYARKIALAPDESNCPSGAPLALEAALADTLFDGIRFRRLGPSLGMIPDPATMPRLEPPRRRRAVQVALIGGERLTTATIDAVALWRRGLERATPLFAGQGSVRVVPTPNVVGIRLEASYAATRVPLSLSARVAQSLPAITPNALPVGKLGLGLRWRTPRLVVQLDWGRTYIGLAHSSDIAAALVSIPL
jgi:hypothetical protein